MVMQVGAHEEAGFGIAAAHRGWERGGIGALG